MKEFLCIRSELQKKELDLARVRDANYDLTEERVQLTTKLTDYDKKMKERKEEIQRLKMQYATYLSVVHSNYHYCSNHEIELQVSQLKLEINTLHQMQMEWEQYKKKVEASSR